MGNAPPSLPGPPRVSPFDVEVKHNSSMQSHIRDFKHVFEGIIGIQQQIGLVCTALQALAITFQHISPYVYYIYISPYIYMYIYILHRDKSANSMNSKQLEPAHPRGAEHCGTCLSRGRPRSAVRRLAYRRIGTRSLARSLCSAKKRNTVARMRTAPKRMCCRCSTSCGIGQALMERSCLTA